MCRRAATAWREFLFNAARLSTLKKVCTSTRNRSRKPSIEVNVAIDVEVATIAHLRERNVQEDILVLAGGGYSYQKNHDLYNITIHFIL